MNTMNIMNADNVKHVCFATFLNWWIRPVEAPQMHAFGHTIETQGDLILWILVANSCKLRATSYEPKGREVAALVNTKSGKTVQKIASVQLNELVELEGMNELVCALYNMAPDAEDEWSPMCFIMGAMHAYVDALDYVLRAPDAELEEQKVRYMNVYKKSMAVAGAKQALIEATLQGEQHIGKRAEMADRVEHITDSPESIVAEALRKMAGGPDTKH